MEIPEFGIKRENEVRCDGGCAVIFDPVAQKYAVNKWSHGLLGLISGGVDDSEDIQEGVLREVEEESGLHDFLYVEKIAEAMTHYHNIVKKLNRVGKATDFLIILRSRDQKPLKLEAHEKFTLDWVSAQEILDNWAERNDDHGADHWIYFLKKSVARARELGYDTTSEITT